MVNLITLEEIEAARAILPSQVRRTPILPFSRSSGEVGRETLFLKLENHQPMGAYKVRASFYLLQKMSPEDRAKGVVLGSSGNFAQGFAYAGRELGVKVAVVMMRQVSPYKVEAVRGFGGEVVFCDNEYLARQPKVEEISRERGMVAVDTEGREAMIGHSSLALEIIEDMPNVDTVVTPVAAGGLLGSVATAIKLNNPRVRVIGAQPEGAPAMSRSFKAGEPVTVERWRTMCDALSSTRPGDVPFQHVKEYV
jgi:threonine dehydratase